MDLLRTFDRELLELATGFGGAELLRDQIVFFLAQILPYAFYFAAVWLFFTGKTRPQIQYNRETVVLMLGGAALAWGVRTLIADAISRPRPFITYPELHTLPLTNDIVSFPSGHAFMLFTAAGVVFFTGKHPKLGILLLVLAAIVGVARVAAGVHYPTDIVGGAVLGLALGKVLSMQSKWVSRQLK